MDMSYPSFMCPLFNLYRNVYLLDVKLGDVNGDGKIDKVSLYGNKPDGAAGIFADNITVVIQYGDPNQIKTIIPKFNSGYNARLFLGDFTKDRIKDIKVSIDSGGSGGYGFYYIYSFKNNILKEIFDFNKYNETYKFQVNYRDLYKVDISSINLNKLFVLDISYKGSEYLSNYYDKNGRLKKPIQGEALDLGVLTPVVNNEKLIVYDIIGFQRIIGTFNADTLGYIENLLTWNGVNFTSSRIVASTPGTNLISS
ncbi:hypothetical protein [Clostridium pasteurianum]|uniref:FG-GAP repeat protein n=1 Tax=Clostridium pasteurianum BC1 TaxID=86416 RepID=R4K7H4_CLOPA|nr:hypothetical protein [Clostridium pasteurianum]AGK99132.1 hypothetical protein Clopa_4420 [Clostridium pasteurianum BC1]